MTVRPSPRRSCQAPPGWSSVDQGAPPAPDFGHDPGAGRHGLRADQEDVGAVEAQNAVVEHLAQAEVGVRGHGTAGDLPCAIGSCGRAGRPTGSARAGAAAAPGRTGRGTATAGRRAAVRGTTSSRAVAGTVVAPSRASGSTAPA